MKIIPIKLPNKLASVPCRVDDEDYEHLVRFNWRAHKGWGKYDFYASAYITPGKDVLMHRFILKPTSGQLVDHIDHDGLNNQKSNLRLCSRSENAYNQRKRTNNASGFKGVHWANRPQKYIASITVEGKAVHIGSFDTVLEAAKAYDEEALKLHGAFAKLNGV